MASLHTSFDKKINTNLNLFQAAIVVSTLLFTSQACAELRDSDLENCSASKYRSPEYNACDARNKDRLREERRRDDESARRRLDEMIRRQAEKKDKPEVDVAREMERGEWEQSNKDKRAWMNKNFIKAGNIVKGFWLMNITNGVTSMPNTSWKFNIGFDCEKKLFNMGQQTQHIGHWCKGEVIEIDNSLNNGQWGPNESLKEYFPVAEQAMRDACNK